MGAEDVTHRLLFWHEEGEWRHRILLDQEFYRDFQVTGPNVP